MTFKLIGKTYLKVRTIIDVYLFLLLIDELLGDYNLPVN